MLNSLISNYVGINPLKRDDSDKTSNGLGNAGSIFINTKYLEIYNEGKITSSGFSEGNSGDLVIYANNILLDRGELFSIIIGEKGDVGDVTINATESIDVINGSIILAQSIGNAEGDSGNININTRSLNLQGRSLIIADKQGGKGKAGDVTINAIDSVTIEGLDENPSETYPQITVQLQGNAMGNAGNIVIYAPTISLANFGFISANATEDSMGEPGTVTLNGDRISITKGAIIDALTETVFDGGDININTNSLELSNGGKIIAGNDKNGNGGNIDLNITGDLILQNGNPPGDCPFEEQILQDLTFETGIFANNAPGSTGDGGSISITADSIQFEDRGSITTETFSGKGGNIHLKVNDIISLRNNSLISAKAGVAGDGGNININADFIIAFPSQPPENGNDIVTRAEGIGKGGNINITALSLFGIEERSAIKENGTNDIDASSEFGLQGNVSINTPIPDLTSVLIELPETVSDATDQISQNICEQGVGSEFIITGKGGLPPNPYETLNSDEEQVGLVEPVPLRQGDEETERRGGEIKLEEDDIRLEKSTPEAVPAQGWIFMDNGQVMLTSYKTPDTEIKRSPQKTPNICPTP